VWTWPCLLSLGAVFSAALIVEHGLTLLTAAGPILIGIGAVYHAFNVHQSRLSDESRFALIEARAMRAEALALTALKHAANGGVK